MVPVPVFLALSVWLAAAGALLSAAVGHWSYARHGFGRAFLEAVHAAWLPLSWQVPLVLAGAMLARWAIQRRWGPGRRTSWLAAALWLAPLYGWWVYRVNIERLPGLLSPISLLGNLALAAGFAILLPAAAAALEVAIRRGGDRGRPARAALAIATATLLVAGIAPPALRSRGQQTPKMVVIVIDALRADHLGIAGYRRPTTPNLDALARAGLWFTQAISQGTFTGASIASLFTGLYPYRHGLYEGSRRERPDRITSDVLDHGLVTLAERLRDHGLFTGAWIQQAHLAAARGYAQGFLEYQESQGTAPRLSRSFLAWAATTGRQGPFFAYLHYIDLHDPYRPAPPFDRMFGRYSEVYAGVDFKRWGEVREQFASGRRRLSAADVDQLRAYYDGQLRFVDREIGHLLDRLKRLGLYDQSWILVTADHGDGFMEHGFVSHSNVPYEELIRVPLILKLPGGRRAGARIDRQVRLIDVMPTLLEAAGAATPPGLDGRSLLSLLDRRVERDGFPRLAIAEWRDALALRDGRHKYIRGLDGRSELYDLAADPLERRNLVVEQAERAQAFERQARALLARRGRAGVRVVVDPRSVEELRALGYVR